MPHHLTQRGVRRQNVFFTAEDRDLYKSLLAENAHRYGLEIIAYCLMTNHVHLLVVPLEEDSLRWTFQYTHRRYAAKINSDNGWTGHLWQERFYSSPVDEDFFWITLRYIERNPLQAGLVRNHPAEYRWSSASAHCENKDDALLTKAIEWKEKISTISDWRSWLSEEDDSRLVGLLRKNTQRDLPTGSKSFLDQLESRYNVKAHPPILGRPKKKEK